MKLRETAILLLSATLLAGCGANRPSSDTLIAPRVSPLLLACQSAPTAPDATSYTDVDLASYIVDLFAAGQDCRDKLAAVNHVLSTDAARMSKP